MSDGNQEEPKEASDVLTEPEHFLFIRNSEPFLEKWLFKKAHWALLLTAILTVVLFIQMLGIKPDARIEKLIPLEHPYIQNFLKHRDALGSAVSQLKVVVSVTDGDVFSADYFSLLQKVTDEAFFISGVDRSGMKSLWTPNVRWTEVTEEGFQGGPIFPSHYQGSQTDVEEVRSNILKSGQVGRLVANDFKSTLIEVPLYEKDPTTGEKLDYSKLSTAFEEKIRNQYQSDYIRVHIIGVPKIIADLIEGFKYIVLFFLLAVLISLVLLWLHLRCFISGILVLLCSLSAVIWQLGLVKWLGYGIDPYSVLVPFLVFAIAVSHGVQIVNGIMHWQAEEGMSPESSARLAFRQLYVPGMLALVSDAIGFLTLMFIDIGVIQELAITASIGIAAIIVTNLFILPVICSKYSMRQAALDRVRFGATQKTPLWVALSHCAERVYAKKLMIVFLILMGVGIWGSLYLEIGDLDQGAPELHPDSRYNLDNQFVVDNYTTSSDVLVIMTETPAEGCTLFPVLEGIDLLMWQLNNTVGVQGVVSLTTVAKLVTKGYNEGYPAWEALPRNQAVLNTSVQRAPTELINADCSMTPVAVYLDDHKADTLKRVVAAVETFKDENDTENLMNFKLASGNAGVEAATNAVIEQAQYRMLVFVYVVVGILCWLTFRSWRALICILSPLLLTSMLCQALMAWLGIGVKVATLPVIVLGVGIGVDYGIYIFSKYESMLIQKDSARDAYYETLISTGKAVGFTGITLAIGVATWIFSLIKFQADMGVLLTFMFLWNMVGALIFIPAFAAFVVDPIALKERHQRLHGQLSPA